MHKLSHINTSKQDPGSALPLSIGMARNTRINLEKLKVKNTKKSQINLVNKNKCPQFYNQLKIHRREKNLPH